MLTKSLPAGRRHTGLVTSWMMATCFTLCIVLTCTGGIIFFPYDANPANIAPKRLNILHTSQEMYVENRQVYNDFGISIKEEDDR